MQIFHFYEMKKGAITYNPLFISIHKKNKKIFPTSDLATLMDESDTTVIRMLAEETVNIGKYHREEKS